IAQTLLIAQAFGDVVDELISADAPAVAIAEDVEPHFVPAPIAGPIAELADIRELLARQRAAPDSLNRGVMLRQMRRQIEHAVADARTDTEDPLELIGCGAIDRQPTVIEVCNLHERVGSFDDVCQELAFGERFVDAALEGFVQDAEMSFALAHG